MAPNRNFGFRRVQGIFLKISYTVLPHIEGSITRGARQRNYSSPMSQNINNYPMLNTRHKRRSKPFGFVFSSNYLNFILVEATNRNYFVPVFSKHQSH
tara:strand:+ start:143 stop:436 length:294 start_codon:yes stop_codon:yes gene_type:complete